MQNNRKQELLYEKKNKKMKTSIQQTKDVYKKDIT